ncbi:MAG: AarF/UbiB family protein [Anaerolineales bacterium]|nr:AarF/UbiB family protein [Anaerolineales bacterium]
MLRKRYRRIIFFFARVILSLIFWELILAKAGLKAFSKRTRPDRLRLIAIRFRALATDMGGVMIKVGQFLSSRVDVLPEEITKELADLQDEVAPEDFQDILRVAEADLGGPLQTFFLDFQEKPLAAASLGQVHQALLHQPEDEFQQVVVKVQRPHIDKIIETDIAALQTVGKWIKRYKPVARRADVPGLLKEFAAVTYDEINYLAEGKNAEIFRENFKKRPGVRVPQVVWPYTTRRVLTLENVQAIKITDYEAITAAGISRVDVAQRLFETYLQQIFEDGFFHADPHPGNLFIAPGTQQPPPGEPDLGEERPWTLTFVDFGMVGQVPPNIRAGLREMAIGVGTQDSSRIIKSYQMLGVLLPNADLGRIQELETRAFEQFWGKSMLELQQISFEEMHDLAKEFREIIYDMPFQIPENLIFLVRCVAILSGMCTGLNPNFNVWEGLTPFAQKIIREETAQGWDFWRAELGDWGRSLIFLPGRLDSVLQKIENGKMAVDTPTLNLQAARLERTGRRLTNSVIFAVLFFSGVQLYLAGEVEFSLPLFLGSLLPLWRSIFSKK